MKFTIERGALLRAVAQAQSVVERRNTIPILANVLIEAAQFEGAIDRHQDGLSVGPIAAAVAVGVLPDDHGGANLPFSVVIVRWNLFLIQEGKESLAIAAPAFHQSFDISIPARA